MVKILFAAPDPRLTNIYSQKLKQQSFVVDSVHDGLSALRLFNASPVHIVISEYELPILSGIALLKFIRSHRTHYSIPFIFFTDHQDNSLALGLGANDWIEKQDAVPEFLIDRIYHHLKVNKNLILNHGI